MYTGDDFNYAELIAGDGERAIRTRCSASSMRSRRRRRRRWRRSARGGENEFFDILEPTVPLSRHIFKAPTRFYKTGVVFLAYLNGLQDHFAMIGGQQSARSLLHLAELFRLADKARVLRDPDTGGGADDAGAGGAGDRMSVVEASRGCRSTSRPSAEQWDLRAGGRRLPAARHHGDRALARPGGGDRARGGRAAGARQRPAGHRALPRRDVSGRDGGGRARAIEDNKRAIDEAAALGADCLVLVVGGLPAGSKDIAAARRDGARRDRGDAAHARAAGVPLAIEPLHPMYAADRACVNTLEQALDLCDELGDGVGVAIDVYHVWWDPELAAQIARAGAAGQILAHHICDWLVPTTGPAARSRHDGRRGDRPAAASAA